MKTNHIMKFKKVGIDYLQMLSDTHQELEQVLIYNNISDCYFNSDVEDILSKPKVISNINQGKYECYLLSFKGRELFTDEEDLQDILDMVDDGVFNEK